MLSTHHTSFGFVRLATCLVHYRKLEERLPVALSCLGSLGLNPYVVSQFDGDQIRKDFCRSLEASNTWDKHVEEIRAVLEANYLLSRKSQSFSAIQYIKEINKIYKAMGYSLMRPWMRSRVLLTGEISVLLKHWHALSLIAEADCDYGIIAEDDILETRNGKEIFNAILSDSLAANADYVDLAGGCSLSIHEHKSEGITSTIVYLGIPSTRTNACYLVSRKLAARISNLFFPFSMPIDWHLTYLMWQLVTENIRVYWSTSYPLAHGSEIGTYRSWRHPNV